MIKELVKLLWLMLLIDIYCVVWGSFTSMVEKDTVVWKVSGLLGFLLDVFW